MKKKDLDSRDVKKEDSFSLLSRPMLSLSYNQKNKKEEEREGDYGERGGVTFRPPTQKSKS
jgi:hypothetical protein